jgi:hypothetical protein
MASTLVMVYGWFETAQRGRNSPIAICWNSRRSVGKVNPMERDSIDSRTTGCARNYSIAKVESVMADCRTSTTIKTDLVAMSTVFSRQKTSTRQTDIVGLVADAVGLRDMSVARRRVAPRQAEKPPPPTDGRGAV